MSDPKPKQRNKKKKKNRPPPRSPRRDDFHYHDRRGNSPLQSDHFDQQRLNLDNDLHARLTFSENQNRDLICQLEAVIADRDTFLRKLNASDLASQRMAEELMKKTHQESDNAQEERNFEQLALALEENKKKDNQIKELKKANQVLEKKVEQKRKDVIYYKKKSEGFKARITLLESEVEGNRKKIENLDCTIQTKECRIQELIKQIVKTPDAKKPVEAKQSVEKEMTFTRIKLEPPSDSVSQTSSVFNIANMATMETDLEEEQRTQETQSSLSNEYPVGVNQKVDDTVASSEIQPEEMVSFIQIGENFAQLKKDSLPSKPNTFPTSNVSSTSSVPNNQFQQSSFAKTNPSLQSNVPINPALQSSHSSFVKLNPFTAPFSGRSSNVQSNFYSSNFAPNIGSSFPTQGNPGDNLN